MEEQSATLDIDQLRDRLRRETKSHSQRVAATIGLGGSGIILSLVCVGLLGSGSLSAIPLFIAALVMLVGAAMTFPGTQNGCVEILHEIRDPRAYAVILEFHATATGENQIAAAEKLKRLIPRTRELHTLLLTRKGENELLDIASIRDGEFDPELVIVVIGYLAKFGDVKTIRYVRDWAERAQMTAEDKRVSTAAAQVLPVMIRRLELQARNASLLRPAGANGAPSDLLLRPAQGAAGDPALLLRVLEGDAISGAQPAES